MKRLLFVFVSTLLFTSGCAITPVNYGDSSGFMGLGFLAKKTVVLAYDGAVKPLSEVGILALDARLRLRGIRTSAGDVIGGRIFSKGGLGIINTPNDDQIHLFPGEYIASFCFWIERGNQGAIYCHTPLDLAVTVDANEVIQLSWLQGKQNDWTILKQPVTTEVRQRITKDFDDVMSKKQNQ